MRPVGKLTGLLGVVCVVLVSHLAELSGAVSCNPIYRDSQLQLPYSGDALLGGMCDIDGNSGGTVQALGHLSAEQWLHGQVPWWNHYTGIGLPLAAEMQSTSMFLPFVLLLHFKGGMLWMKMSLQAIGGWFMFLVIREMRLASPVSLLGGMFFALNSTQAWFADAPEQPVAFLPMLIFGIERCRAGGGRVFGRGSAIVAISIAMSLYAGFPETAFADGMLALIWALVAMSRIPKSVWWIFGGQIAAGGLTGLLLAAPLLVPFLTGLHQSVMGMHQMAISASVKAPEAVALLLPSLFGPPDGDTLVYWADPYGYFGTGLTILGLVGFANRPADRLRWALFAWILVILATAFDVSAISAIVRALPLFDLLDFARYVAASTTFAAIVLACLAVDDWIRSYRLRVAPCLLVWGIATGATLWLGRMRLAAIMSNGPLQQAVSATTIAIALLTATALILLLRRPATGDRVRALTLVAAIDALIAFTCPELAGSRRRVLDLAPIEFLRAHLGFDRAYAMGGHPGTNYGAYFEFGFLNTAYEPVLKLWDDYIQSLASDQTGEFFMGGFKPFPYRTHDFYLHREAFVATGTRYLIEPTPDDPYADHVPPFLRPVFTDPVLSIYELDRYLPYFTVSEPTCSFVAVSRDQLRTRCDKAASLTRRELAAPGWHATIDGKKAPIRTVGTVFQQIDVPAGTSTIEWRYQPAHARGFTLAFVAGLVGLLIFLRRAVGRRVGQTAPSSARAITRA